jgi:hypothetical protein
MDLSDKELVLLYMVLKGLDTPDHVSKAQFTARVEKILFEFMTIEEVENITDFFRSL